MALPSLSVPILIGIAFILSSVPVQASTSSDHLDEVTIVVLGRRGSGVTSTVRQLLGPNSTIHVVHEAVASTDILEYLVRIDAHPGDNGPSYLKLVDVPGLLAEHTLEHDAEILTSLKLYLEDKGVPTFFIVVFPFDDQHFRENLSQFVELLNRVEFFQRALFETTTDNTIFLLSRLLHVPSETQKNPAARIQEFRSVIQQRTTFPSPVEIVVGENWPDPALNIHSKDGFIELPNDELYPKNIWEKLFQVADKSVMTQGHANEITKLVIQSMIANRGKELHSQELVAHVEDEDKFVSDSRALQYLIPQLNIDLPCNEIQRRLHSSYEKETATTKLSSSLQFLALQVSLRNAHIAEFQQLPQCIKDQVKFFQGNGMTSKYAVHHLEHAFDLHVPEYPEHDLIVGYGYDIINDKSLVHTPFKKNLKPSTTLGYTFPSFVSCEKLDTREEKISSNTTASVSEYHVRRLENLGLSIDDVSQLKGEIHPYLNLKPNETHKLTAVREIRTLECTTTTTGSNTTDFDEHFIVAVNSLPKLNTSDSNSMELWKLFFLTFGTHVVTKGFGGGCLHGELTLTDENLNVTTTKENIEKTLQAIDHFENLNGATEKSLIYECHGGNLDPRHHELHQLQEPVRNKVLNDWKLSLNEQFEMLPNELILIPLSDIINNVDAMKGEDARRATSLLLQGNLSTEPSSKVKESGNLMIHAKAQTQELQTTHIQKELEKIARFNALLNEIASAT